MSRVDDAAPEALKFEQERKIKQEEMLYQSNLWDDLNISDNSLSALADTAKVVESLRDLQYKVLC